MPNFDFDIGIIGGGAAGLTVAAGASQLGAKTLLVEKQPVLGGDCLHFGCVPSKTLIKSARIYHYIKKAGDYGLPGIEVPPVDFSQIAGRIRSVIDTIQHHDSEERFCGLGAKVQFGRPVFRNPHVIELDNRRISARHWVLATGSSPVLPPVPGLDRTPFLTNEDLFSLETLPRSMIVLGGGPIGVEMSQAFCRLGTKVTILQREDRILFRDDPDMAAVVRTALEDDGVSIQVNVNVEEVKPHGKGLEVAFSQNNQGVQRIRADKLLVAAGRDPNVKGLGLESIGVKTNRGVVVDQRLRTSQKHIFAAGDVTGRYQFTHAAGYEGGIVVANAVFRLPRRVDYTWLPWCTYADPELAGIGMNESAARSAGLDYEVWEEAFRDNDRSQAEGETRGKLKLILDKNEKPLGVQIVGYRAGDLLSEWTAVLGSKVKLSTLAGLIHPYPTLGEINKRVAGQYMFGQGFFRNREKRPQILFSFKRPGLRTISARMRSGYAPLTQPT